MVRRNGVLVPLAALLLGALAIAFNFIAYAKSRISKVREPDGSCVYSGSSSPSTALGIMAAIFLLAEQILISAATYCFCCCGQRCSAMCTTITSIIFFIGSWITFAIAFLGLVSITLLGSTSNLARDYPSINKYNCDMGKQTLFLGTGFWCIISVVLGLISYAFWKCGASKRNNKSLGVANLEQGVAMGEPHYGANTK